MWLELTDGTDKLSINAHLPSTDGYFVTDKEIKGLFSTPVSKTNLSERQSGNGAHLITNSDVLYSARTIEFTLCAYPAQKGEYAVETARDRVNRMAGKLITLNVYSAEPFYVQGFLEVEWSGKHHQDVYDMATVTLTCPRAERFSINEQTLTLWPGYTNSGGLNYATNAQGLQYPVNYGQNVNRTSSTVTLENHGTTPAFPQFTVFPGLNEGVLIDWYDSQNRSGTLTWKHNPTSPAIIDCFTKTASENGIDQSGYFQRRAFPQVPAKGSLTLHLSSTGSGYVIARCRSTWI